MNDIEFYYYLNNNLNNLARLYGINNLNSYYSRTDYSNANIASLNGVNQLFAQYIMHAQNGTMISSIVNFNNKFDDIKRVLFDFSPCDVISNYHINVTTCDNEVAAKSIVDAFRGVLTWTTEKSKTPDVIITRFANSIIDGAIYFAGFNSRDGVINDLLCNYVDGDYRRLIEYALNIFKHGFSVALCCDFLKEISNEFDLPKPDVHLMEVIGQYKYQNKDYYKGSKSLAYQFIGDIIQIVNTINNSQDGDPELTVYQLDRMIWLCCTGNFFLSNANASLKENLLKGIC